MANFIIPRVAKKDRGEKCFKFCFTKSISSKKHKKSFLKTNISIAKNGLDKINHTKHRYSLFFKTRGKNQTCSQI